MHVLRLLRIFIPLLLVAAIVAGVVRRADVALRAAASHDAGRRHVGAAAQRSSTTRYGTLDGRQPGGAATSPGRCTRSSPQVDARVRQLAATSRRTAAASTSQVDAANNLEALGRRLVHGRPRRAPARGQHRRARRRSTRSRRSTPADGATPFDDAVDHFEQRAQPARPPASRPASSATTSIPAYDATDRPC